MKNHRIDLAKPSWQPCPIDIGRRRALLGLTALVAGAAGGGRAWAQTPARCVLTPEAGEGPFYLDPKLLRSDITSGQPGAPLNVALQVVREGDCATLANARVDVWQANALGLYSGYTNQSGVGGVSAASAAGQQYLRGTQVTDMAGNVRFQTIFPSWYGGRTPHLHFKIFLGGKEVVASQIFVPDEVSKEIYSEWAPYRDHVAKRKVFNANDTIPQGIPSEVSRSGRMYSAKAVLVVARGKPLRLSDGGPARAVPRYLDAPRGPTPPLRLRRLRGPRARALLRLRSWLACASSQCCWRWPQCHWWASRRHKRRHRAATHQLPCSEAASKPCRSMCS
jgi:protocatechuate 3,4-dioxygenase beta subunit